MRERGSAAAYSCGGTAAGAPRKGNEVAQVRQKVQRAPAAGCERIVAWQATFPLR